jgi:16S rRNA (guanine527-N7)-methyltransferase
VALDLEASSEDDEWRQGLLALKGGELSGEIEELRAADSTVEIERLSLESLLGQNGFFGEKEIVAIREA